MEESISEFSKLINYIFIHQLFHYNKLILFLKEFEDPTDPFQPHRRRYEIELNRYLNNVNMNFNPPMPKPPVYRTRSQNDVILNSKRNRIKSTSTDKYINEIQLAKFKS